MTVIAFDGKTLAADKMAESSGHARTVRKIFRIDGHMLAVSGAYSTGMALLAWWAKSQGEDLNDFPKSDSEEMSANLWVVKPNGSIFVYENSPFALPFEDRTFASGCGRDYALGAMAHGADAVEAVRIAIENDIHCGCGIDTLVLGEEREPD